MHHLTDTIATLNHLATWGHNVLAQKAHICQQAVRFPGFLFKPSRRSLIGLFKQIRSHCPQVNSLLESCGSYMPAITGHWKVLLGKEEQMNHILKKNVAKLCEETQLHWDQVLHIVLLRTRLLEIEFNWVLMKLHTGNHFRLWLGWKMNVDQEVKVKNYEQHLRQTLAVIHDLSCVRDLSPQVCYDPLRLEVRWYSRLGRQDSQKAN